MLQPLQGGRGSTGQGTQGLVFLSKLPLSGLVILGKSLLGSEPQFPSRVELILPPSWVGTNLTE